MRPGAGGEALAAEVVVVIGVGAEDAGDVGAVPDGVGVGVKGIGVVVFEVPAGEDFVARAEAGAEHGVGVGDAAVDGGDGIAAAGEPGVLFDHLVEADHAGGVVEGQAGQELAILKWFDDCGLGDVVRLGVSHE